MATARPVISCPMSGIPELVRDGETGVLVPPDDPRRSPTRSRRSPPTTALRLELGARGRALVERQHDERLTAAALLAKIRAADARGAGEGTTVVRVVGLAGDDRSAMVGDGMLDQMRRQTEDIVRYYGELNRRIANAGMDGIPKLLEVSTQLELALGEIGAHELTWVADEIKRLLDELVRMDSQLQRLRELKMMFEGAPDQEEPARRRSAI